MSAPHLAEQMIFFEVVSIVAEPEALPPAATNVALAGRDPVLGYEPAERALEGGESHRRTSAARRYAR